jgi:hypothetical protein
MMARGLASAQPRPVDLDVKERSDESAPRRFGNGEAPGCASPADQGKVVDAKDASHENFERLGVGHLEHDIVRLDVVADANTVARYANPHGRAA